MKKFIYRYFPWAVALYHFKLAFWGALWYGFPSRKLYVIGVTGTKGKTTTCNLIAQFLNSAGYKTGLATTVNFGIGDTLWENASRQTMPGRFQLQKLLRRFVDEGCHYAVIETSSEGILQYRHRFIDYRAAVFTNLFPEHLDRHGSFENYRAAKVKLFEQVAKRHDGVGIYNLDDENVEYFLKPAVAHKYGYAISDFPLLGKEGLGEVSESTPSNSPLLRGGNIEEVLEIKNIQLSAKGSSFERAGQKFTTPLLGEFNVGNIAAAMAVARSQNIPWEKIQTAVGTAWPVTGRIEVVDRGQPFSVVIDYAYDPNGLKAALEALKIFKPKRIIVLTGIAAIGRDRWQWERMGEVADGAADIIVVTTDDPGDLPPEGTIDAVAAGALKNPKRVLGENIFKIIDRREAIQKAISLAKSGDVVLLAGKGGETAMKISGGRKIPWNEREVAEETLEKPRYRDKK